MTGTGLDTLNTKPTFSVSNTTIGGVTVSSPSSGAFSSAGSTTANFSLTFTQTSNGTSAISTSSLVSNGLIKPEGIGDTAAGLASTATGTVLNAGTVVGNAAAAVSGSNAYTSQFTSGTLQAQVAQGTAYANLSSIVTSGVGNLGTVATILAGSNNSTPIATVGMTWRTRAGNELPGTATSPPMGPHAGYLSSDVMQLSGIGVSSGTTTDVYVLQMSYSSGVFPGSTPQSNFTSGYLWLGTYNTSSGTSAKWTLATSLDASTGQYAETGGTVTPSGTGYNGSFANFWAAAQAAGATNLSQVLGAWGVDTDTGPNTGGQYEAWAVLDYDNNAQFAVVAEPGTFVLLAAGGLALVPVIRRRRRRKASKKA